MTLGTDFLALLHSSAPQLDVLWEGASMRGGFYYLIYLANDEFGMGIVIPNAEWVKGELRELLDELVSY